MRIDLHTHSTASDGTDPPAGLVAAAVAAGLDVVALTDHDTLQGWDEARAAAPAGLVVVPGVEVSAFASVDGSPRRISLHLLGLWPDATDAALLGALDGLRAGRETRTRRLVEAIAADGYDVSWARVRADAGGSVGRPHVARALVAAGLVADVGAAFTPEWIGGPGARYWVDKPELPVLEAIGLLRAAGAAVVFAHPFAARRGPVVDDDVVEAMAAAGLTGLEADHPDHLPAERMALRGLAARLGLVVTGSSDYHGGNKPNRLGQETTAPAAYAALSAAAGQAAA